MKILLIKTSSMGDLIHTLPALTDARAMLPGLQVDWVCEEAFCEIPAWHPLVNSVISVALRRWRHHPIKAVKSGEWSAFKKMLRAESYDVVIDAQGLLKSAWLTRKGRGIRCGYDWRSAREPAASLFYENRFSVNVQQHAISRIRQLFAKSLGYVDPSSTVDYGIKENCLEAVALPQKPYWVFLHATARAEKLWPNLYWSQLANKMTQLGYSVLLPWGNSNEYKQAQCIAANVSGGVVLPKLSLSQLAFIFKKSAGVVAVDTGLGHLASALSVPTFSLYGPTQPLLIGAKGEKAQHIVASSMSQISPYQVFAACYPHEKN